jgi:outer membrane protein assembly factor BamE
MFRTGNRKSLRAFVMAASAICLAACSTRPTLAVPDVLKPYKPEIVQGNFVSREQVAALRAGMPKTQVLNILGTPLLTDIFHTERWDYVFTIERAGVISKPRRLTVHFKDDLLERWEGDTMPSEAEFVRSLDSGRKIGTIPPLTATERELAEFSARENSKLKATNNPTTGTDGQLPPSKTYPPLESQ